MCLASCTAVRNLYQWLLFSGDAPPREVLENEVEGGFLIEDDAWATNALKGHVLQAIHLLRTGEAFCTAPCCRLYNAHHQEEVIEAQHRDPEFCTDHDELYGHRSTETPVNK